MGNFRKFQNQQNYVRNLYAEQEKITTLTPEQHKLIQTLSTARHKLHGMGWKIYEGRPMAQEVKDFFNLSEEDFYKVGLPYPKTAFKMFSLLEDGKQILSISNPTKDQVINSCRAYMQEKEFINELLEKWIYDIDTQYGTEYRPHHSWHTKNIEEYIESDISYISEEYDKGKFRRAIEALSLDRDIIHSVNVENTNTGIRQITGMYETTPFTVIMSDSGKIADITMHTPTQDLDPADDVARVIANRCRRELEKAKEIGFTKENKTLFISMDNTIVDLTKGLMDINNKIQLKNIYEALEKPAFFKSLEAISPMLDAVRVFVKSHPEVEVFILSTARPEDPPGVKKQKDDWLNRNLPEIPPTKRIMITPDMSKSKMIRQFPENECYLIDSDLKNLKDFASAGGRTIYAAQSNDEYLHDNNLFIDISAKEIYELLERQTSVKHVNYVSLSRTNININASITDRR